MTFLAIRSLLWHLFTSFSAPMAGDEEELSRYKNIYLTEG